MNILQMRISLICIFLLLNITVFSQSFSLSGKINDEATKEPIQYANAILTSPMDSSIILGAITDSTGKFTIINIESNTYQLKLSFIGYQTLLINNINVQDKNIHIGERVLSVLTENIEDITVSGKRNPFIYKVDRKVINPESFPEADVAIDLLENIPSIQVDIDGKLTYRGDGTFMVFINGHPVSNGDEKLKLIQADRIESLEIITNPSAKYDAEGTAGIINILLKKSRLQGYAISTSLKGTTRESYEWLFSVDKKGEKGGWYIKGQYANNVWSKFKMSEYRETTNDVLLYEIISEEDRITGGINNYIEFGINYDLSSLDYIDLSLYINPLKCTNVNDNKGFVYEKTDSTFGLISENNFASSLYNELFYRYGGATITYEHAFNKKRSHLVSLFIDFSSYLHNLEQKQIDTKTYENETEKYGYIWNEQNEILINSKLNYSLPIRENYLFEIGSDIRIDHIPKITSISGFFDEEENITPFESPKLNQEVNFTQDIYSAYFTFKGKWVKLDYKFGLRTEYTNRKSDYSYENESGIKIMNPLQNDFINYFPTFHFSYNFTETHQISTSYSRRIQRPDYWNLIPLSQYSDIYSYYKGNGELIPAFTDAYEVSYGRSWDKDFIALEVFARKTENVIQNYYRRDTMNILVQTPENVGQSISIGMEIMGGLDLFSWWNANLSMSLYLYQLDINFENRIESQFKTDTRLNNTFSFPKSFFIKWSFLYNSPSISVQNSRDGYFYSNVAVKKGIKDNKWLITIAYFNLFSTVNYSTISEDEGFYIETQTIAKPYLSLKITYNFDNQK